MTTPPRPRKIAGDVLAYLLSTGRWCSLHELRREVWGWGDHRSLRMYPCVRGLIRDGLVECRGGGFSRTTFEVRVITVGRELIAEAARNKTLAQERADATT